MRRLLLGLALGSLLLGPAVSSGPRIACLGDSLTQGDGDDRGLGWPGRVKQRSGGELLNLGQSGWTSEMVLRGYEGQPSQVSRARTFKPEVVCLWVGSNDLWYLYEYNDPTAADEKANLTRFRSDVHAILGSFPKCRFVVALLDDQSRRPVAVKGEAFPGTSPAELKRMSAQVKLYNQALRAEAQAVGGRVVDFSADRTFTDPSLLADDGNHPNARGYDHLAELWWAALK